MVFPLVTIEISQILFDVEDQTAVVHIFRMRSLNLVHCGSIVVVARSYRQNPWLVGAALKDLIGYSG